MIHIDQSDWLNRVAPAQSDARSIGSILRGLRQVATLRETVADRVRADISPGRPQPSALPALRRGIG